MVGFSLGSLEATCTCVRCGEPRQAPDIGKPRLPSRMGDDLTVQADDPCSCGSLRVRISMGFEGDQAAADERDASPSETVPESAR